LKVALNTQKTIRDNKVQTNQIQANVIISIVIPDSLK
jgi:hypothetical protein